MLITQNIEKSYGDLSILKGVSLSVQKADIVSIVGPSGAGKSTLLHILGTLDTADRGTLEINQVPVHQLKGKALSKFRNEHLGFIFQFHHLLPEFTALENICIPAFIANVGKKQAQMKAEKWLEFFGLSDRAHHKPSSLSGGEAQRIAVARALINDPLVVFADEPSGNLDSVNAKALHELFVHLKNEFQQTFVIVTHNDELAKMANVQLRMADGNIVSQHLV